MINATELPKLKRDSGQYTATLRDGRHLTIWKYNERSGAWKVSVGADRHTILVECDIVRLFFT
jgi:hypothetical protein